MRPVERRAGGSVDGQLLLGSGSDPDAFRIVYDRHARAVFDYFARRVEDRQTCYDLTAETFAALYLERDRYDPERGTLEQWLFGLARNHLARYQRKRSVEYRAMRKLRVRDAVAETVTTDDTDAVVERMAVAQVTPALRAGMAALSPSDRRIVELRVIEGRSYAEIADELGCTRGAARVRAFRAVKRLGNQVRADQQGLYEVEDR